MARVFLGLGSNLGNREKYLQTALLLLTSYGVDIIRRSSLYVTAPYGGVDQDDFLNMVAEAEVWCSPQDLLDLIHEIEAGCGRVREVHWGPRTLDIDILTYDDLRLDSPELTLPHPEIKKRAFVLVPFAELAADCEIPGEGRVGELLAALAATAPTEIDGVRRLPPERS